MIVSLLVITIIIKSVPAQDPDVLLDLDASFYGPKLAKYGVQGFPVLPPPRTTRQTAGTAYQCVPAGSCATPNGTNTIDPRIVTQAPETLSEVLPKGGTGGPGTTPTACAPGFVPCFGDPSGLTCGKRYVANTNTVDGPSSYGAFPWQAYILNRTASGAAQYTGSGVLVDSLHVVTAAHKVNLNEATPGNIQVLMGVYNPADMRTVQNRTVTAIVIHPAFKTDPSVLKNDIAVLRLNEPVSLGYQLNIATACLPAAGTSFVNRANCVVSGWGVTAFTANDAPTNPQKQVYVGPIVNYTTCRVSMAQQHVLGTNVDKYLDPNGEICAGGLANKDACTQDGGSPLVCPNEATGRFDVAGLVIWGKNCGQPGVYGVYVDLAYYRAWIDQAIAQTA